MRRGYPRTLVESPQGTAAPTERLGRIGPAVRAIVVAHEPGEWFAECLRSLRDQDYAALSVTVVNVSGDGDGVDDDPAGVVERVAEVLPDATVMTVPGNPGFAPAANAAARLVAAGNGEAPPEPAPPADPDAPAGSVPDAGPPGDGEPAATSTAAFLLICHDDVAPAPDTVTRLVYEATERRAAIAGPKLVDWEDPRFLQSVGLSSDRMGVPVPLVTAGEYDQGQHDAVGEVLAVPSACMLIRTEVFERLGGFDDAMTYHGEDLDIGRRANLAGESVLVVPAARVRHRGRLAERRPRRDRDLLSFRHQLRSVLVCANRSLLPAEVPAMLALSGLEAALAVLAGHFRRAAALLGAWWWNLLGLSEIISRRRQIGEARHDARVRGLTGRGYVSLARFADRLLRGDATVEAGGVLWGKRRRLPDAVRDASLRTAAVAWIVAVAVVVFGSRHLLTRGIPVFGEFALLGESPAELFRAWFSNWREAGLGSEGPAPTAYGILTVAGSILFGEMGLARTVLVLGLVPFGAAGLWRLLAPARNRRVQIVGLAAFVAMPLPYNALANGVWSALAVYALLPWICLWLSRVLGPPTASSTAPSRGFLLPAAVVGILVGLLGAFVPVAPLAVVMLVAALVVGGLLAGEARGILRLAGAAAGGLVLGWLLNWPAGAASPDALLAHGGARPDPRSGLGVTELLRFATGSAVGGRLTWGLLAAGGLALLVRRGSSFVWAVRAWSLLVVSVLVALTAEHGWIDANLPRPEVLLAPGAFGLALAIALAAGATAADVASAPLRRALAGAGLVALVAGAVPMLALTLDGRWGTPRGDFTTPLATVQEESRLGAFRILWVGHPDVLPLGGWALDDRLVFATSTAAPPGVGLQWPGSEPAHSDRLRDAWQDAMAGRTDRMGASLATLGVRYVVVMERVAPEPFGDLVRPVPGEVDERLDAQFDLERRESRGGLAVYRNMAWRPTRALLDGPGDVTEERIAGSQTLALPGFDPPATARGSLPPGSTLYLADAAGGWQLHIDGRRIEPRPALGWAQSFDTGSGGEAILRHAPRASNVVRIVGWVLVLSLVPLAYLRRRRAADPPDLAAEPADDPAGDVAIALLAAEREEH